MSDDMKSVGFEANADSYERAKEKLEHGEMSERLRETIDQIAYGVEVTEAERKREKLNNLREERRSLKREKEDIENDIDEKDRKIERVEQRLESLLEQDGKYDGTLEMLEKELHRGHRVMPGSEKVKDAASVGDCTPEEVIDDLKERNPEVPDEAYRMAEPDEEPNWKEQQQQQTTTPNLNLNSKSKSISTTGSGCGGSDE